MLEFRIVGLTQGVTEGEGYVKSPRRLDLLGMLPHQGQRHSANSGAFNHMTQHAHGVGAKRSNRYQKSQVYAFVFEALGDLRAGVVYYPAHIPEGAHERIVVL